MKPRLILLFVILMLIGLYFFEVIPACVRQPDFCYTLHTQMINGTAPAPYRYRILSPALAQLLSPSTDQAGVLFGYLVFHVLTIAAFIVGLYRWLRQWTTQERALIGVLLIALCLSLAFERYLLSGYAMMENALIVWGLVWLHSRSLQA